MNMVSKFRKIIFVSLCISVCSVSLMYQIAKKLEVLPPALDNGTYSLLEASDLQTLPSFVFDSVIKGTYQQEMDDFLGDSFPKREDVILANASMQRNIIELSASLFSYKTIHTFYGSGYVWNTELNVVCSQAEKGTKGRANNFNSVASALNKLQRKFEGVSIGVALPDTDSYGDSSITASLVSKHLGHTFRENNFYKKLDSSIKVVDLSYQNSDELYKDYYRTDLHWNIKGAYRGYKKIMDTCFPNFEQVELSDLKTYIEPDVIGHRSRGGLCVLNDKDKMIDYDVNLQNMTIKIDGEDRTYEDICHVGMYSSQSWDKNPYRSRYEEYYHNNYAKIEFDTDNHSGRNLVLIGDSFTSCIERLFASSFDKVIAIDSRYFDNSLSQLIEDNAITDIIVVQSDGVLCSPKMKNMLLS